MSTKLLGEDANKSCLVHPQRVDDCSDCWCLEATEQRRRVRLAAERIAALEAELAAALRDGVQNLRLMSAAVEDYNNIKEAHEAAERALAEWREWGNRVFVMLGAVSASGVVIGPPVADEMLASMPEGEG